MGVRTAPFLRVRDLNDERNLRSNFEQVRSHIQELENFQWFPAADGHSSAGLSTIHAVYVIRNMTEAGGSLVWRSTQKANRLWTDGVVQFYILWTASGAATGNFYCEVEGTATFRDETGINVRKMTLSAETFADSGGNAAMNAQKVTNTLPITPTLAPTGAPAGYDLIGVEVERQAAHANDTSTRNLWFHGVLAEYIPTKL